MSQPPGEDRRPRSFVRYVAAGLFNSALDLGLYTLLSTWLRVYPVWSNVISTSITMCISFALNGRWVFRSRQLGVGSFVGFVAITLSSGWLVQGAVIWVILHVLPPLAPSIPETMLSVAAKVVAMGVGMLWNYFGYRWLFSAPRGKGSTDE